MELNRRATLAGAVATGATLRATKAQAATGMTYYGVLNDTQPVAKCPGLAQEIKRIDDEIELLTRMPDGDIEQRFIKLSEALNAQSGALARALAAAEKAATSNAAGIQENTLKAIVAANDLLLATAVQTRNPEFIGGAAGVHVSVGTGTFAFQMISVTGRADVGGAVATLWQGRKSMVTILMKGPGRELAEKQAEMIYELAGSAYGIATGLMDAAKLKTEMQAHRDRVKGLEASKAGLPVNLEQTRMFFINRLLAERSLYALLQSAGTGLCRDPDPQIVAPTISRPLP